MRNAAIPAPSGQRIRPPIASTTGLFRSLAPKRCKAIRPATRSFSAAGGARTLVVQTFDFGTGGCVFGWFEGGLGQGGDDGQVLLLVDRWSTAAMTEDGGAGV